jgi:S-adenosylmethionine synthetase
MNSIRPHLFTSESVTEGHPDKVSDQISDAILDAILTNDKDGHVACETLVTTGMAIITGEVTTRTWVDIRKIVRDTIREIGYTEPALGFDYRTCGVIVSLDEQSPDIAMGVEQSTDHEQGAGDQGLMFGYATKETPELMPLPITLAHKLTYRLAQCRKEGILPWLWPDGKSQVTIEYGDYCCPSRAEAVVIAAHHREEVSNEELREGITREVVEKVIPGELLDEGTKVFINETGRFVVGGPFADTGLTGRKIIVDTYGGVGSHGGGCFSGKDPSKVDRSGSYMARYIAKNIVAAGLAERCEIQIAYAIGVPEPVSLLVDTYGSAAIDEERIEQIVRETFDMRPRAIISHLDLLRPIYKKTAAYGHFGRDDHDFTWELTDKVDELKDKAGL